VRVHEGQQHHASGGQPAGGEHDREENIGEARVLSPPIAPRQRTHWRFSIASCHDVLSVG
jgi:hypothetical protein